MAVRRLGWTARPAEGVRVKHPPAEWEAVRDAIEGGRELPGSVIKGRTRQILRFVQAEDRLPQDVFELVGRQPRVSPMLRLAACDAQQASFTRDAVNPRAALLRLQLPDRPDPRGYRDWSWARHRPRGAALGAGFHLHAHATPPRWHHSPATTDR
jgi:hypothetical protein